MPIKYLLENMTPKNPNLIHFLYFFMYSVYWLEKNYSKHPPQKIIEGTISCIYCFLSHSFHKF